MTPPALLAIFQGLGTDYGFFVSLQKTRVSSGDWTISLTPSWKNGRAAAND